MRGIDKRDAVIWAGNYGGALWWGGESMAGAEIECGIILFCLRVQIFIYTGKQRLIELERPMMRFLQCSSQSITNLISKGKKCANFF